MRSRFLPLLGLALIVVLGFAGVASAASVRAASAAFVDVGPSTLYRGAIHDLAARQILSGFGDGSFRPQDPVTRGQFAKMICKSLSLPVTETDTCPFPDVAAGQDPTDPLYPHRYVGAAAAAGIVRGYEDGMFRPYLSISRAHVVTMIVRAVNALHPDYAPAAETASSARLLGGLATWGTPPDLSRPATRGEVAQILFNLRGLLEAPPGATEPPGGPEPPGATEPPGGAEQPGATEFVVDQAGCSWWCAPRAAYQSSDSRLYLTGVSPTGKAVVAAIRPATGAVEWVEVAALGVDEHNTPALLVPADLPPIVAYANHNTDSMVRIRRGQTVNSISDLLPEQTLASTTGATTYVQLYREPGATNLLLLTRTGSTKWCFARSTDYGVTWSELTPLFDFRTGNKGYVITRQVGTRLHCALYGHPTSSRVHEIYYCVIELDTGAVKRRDGTTVANIFIPAGLPIEVGPRLTLAYDPPPGHNIRLFDISPVGEIAICEWTTDDDAAYKYLYWNGTGWTKRDMVATGVVLGYLPSVHYHGGAAFPDAGAGSGGVSGGGEGESAGGTLYLSREQGGVWSIERWTTRDTGVTWSVQEISRSGTVKLVRPYCPLNGSGVVFTRLYSYNGYRSFDADLVWSP